MNFATIVGIKHFDILAERKSGDTFSFTMPENGTEGLTVGRFTIMSDRAASYSLYPQLGDEVFIMRNDKGAVTDIFPAAMFQKTKA